MLLKLQLIITSMMLMTLFHPLSMVMIVIVSTCLATATMFLSNMNMWFSYILVLAFLGGMMILFMYMSSLIPNEKFFNFIISNNFIFYFFLLIFSMNVNLNKFNSMAFMYNVNWNSLIMIIWIIMVSLMYVFKLIFEPFSPLKSMSS